MAQVITIISIMFGLAFYPFSLHAATSVIDQQQPNIDITAGITHAIASGSEQKLAQVVSAGVSGVLTEVRLPVVCSSGSNLIIEIQNVEQDMPGRIVLTSQTYPASSLPAFNLNSVEFRSLTFATPVRFDAGDKFAVVLTSSGSCGIFPGPLGDSYSGGAAYFDARPNPPGWVCFCDFTRFDLPFQTVVELDPVITVIIDIKPDSYPKSINLATAGTLPVAIFGSPNFDVTTIDPMSLTLAGAGLKLKVNGELQFSFEDLNHDGSTDLLIHLLAKELSLAPGSQTAILEGETMDGMAIRGSDTVRIISNK